MVLPFPDFILTSKRTQLATFSELYIRKLKKKTHPKSDLRELPEWEPDGFILETRWMTGRLAPSGQTQTQGSKTNGSSGDGEIRAPVFTTFSIFTTQEASFLPKTSPEILNGDISLQLNTWDNSGDFYSTGTRLSLRNGLTDTFLCVCHECFVLLYKFVVLLEHTAVSTLLPSASLLMMSQ